MILLNKYSCAPDEDFNDHRFFFPVVCISNFFPLFAHIIDEAEQTITFEFIAVFLTSTEYF